jgi:hypothetical protein
MNNSNNTNGISRFPIAAAVLAFIILFSALQFGTTSCGKSDGKAIPDSVLAKQREDSIKAAQDKERQDKEDYLKAISATGDTNTVYVSSPEDLNVPFETDINAGKTTRRVYNGRRINIAVTGLDSRMGTNGNHADANHVISILIDSGIIEITSIPRDTPADANMEDSLQNKLTIVRANRGRQAYHSELARIAGVDKIHYYVELCFSQAIGALELLGFKDAHSTLQVLRSRKALGGDDYQRCYNQGQFIRQMLMRHFDKFQGLMGEVVIRGGLALLESNLDASTVKGIVEKLQAKGFPRSKSDVSIRVRPPIPINYRVFDFTDQNVVDGLERRIEQRNNDYGSDNDTSYRSVQSRLLRLVKQAQQDSVANKPDRIIKNLKVYVSQKAWWQVRDSSSRNYIRNEMMYLLSHAYTKKKKVGEAKKVVDAIMNEKKLNDSGVLKKTTRVR